MEESLIIDIIKNQPLLLLAYKDSYEYINSFLPYSVGFEIECDKQEDFNISLFNNIPNILDVDCDNYEQRFRIPEGIKGMICLWHISQALKLNSLINPDSGIHYHIDMTDNFHLLNDENVSSNKEWMLEELDKWNYKGDYNKREILFGSGYNWIRFQPSFRTAEFRIGEMTFEYSLLIDRILSATNIIKKLINEIGGETKEIDYKIENSLELINFSQIKYNKGTDIAHLRKKLKDLEVEEEPITQEDEDIASIIRNRLIN